MTHATSENKSDGVCILQTARRWVIIGTILLIWVGVWFGVGPPIWLSSGLIRAPRKGNNLVYWTPHKTGSTSMRLWLKRASHELGSELILGGYYPNRRFEDHHFRTRRTSNCSLIAGHIRVPSVSERRNELELGAVLTTIREPYKLLASKFFHRTTNSLEESDLKLYRDRSSSKSRIWFFHWNDYDPCEQLRYYDGEDGCNLSKLSSRIKAIVNRIDCVVDVDDAIPDLQALCKVMGLDTTRCPNFPQANRKARRSLYDDLFAIKHVREVVDRVANVTKMMRDQLLEKRCRFLGTPQLRAVPGMQPPQWPYAGCHVSSELDDGAVDDAPENDSAQDDDMVDSVDSTG